MEIYRPVCKSVEISASLSSSLACLFPAGLLRGFVSGSGGGSADHKSHFSFPVGSLGARCGGEQGVDTLRAAMAFLGRCN